MLPWASGDATAATVTAKPDLWFGGFEGLGFGVEGLGFRV